MLAQSVLPIVNSHDFSSTLLLGSPDGGQSFTDLVNRIDPDSHDAYRVLGKDDSTVEGDPDTRGKLQTLGKQLGLAPHPVGAVGFRLKRLWNEVTKTVDGYAWVLHKSKYTVYLAADVQVHTCTCFWRFRTIYAMLNLRGYPYSHLPIQTTSP